LQNLVIQGKTLGRHPAITSYGKDLVFMNESFGENRLQTRNNAWGRSL